MFTEYTSVTEMPGDLVSQEQLDMIFCRYYTASSFVKGNEILEVGCGPGLGLGYLRKTARRLVGGDYTISSLKIAKKYYREGINLLSLDAQALPFKNSTFDVVLFFEVIFYLHQPEKFFEDCHRVLKSGGVLIICLPNKEVPSFRPSPLSTKYFNSNELYHLLARYQFKVEIFGAFPIKRALMGQKLISIVRSMAAKVLNIAPAGRKLKESLKKPLLGRNLTLKNEIENNVSNDVQLVPIPPESLDTKHQILYAIARTT